MKSFKSKVSVVLLTSGVILTWLVAVGLVAIMLFYAFIVSGAFAILMPEPPELEIQYAEFPFQLTYELNGEVKIIEDVIICEQTGTASYGTAGKSREWDIRLKSGNETITLLNLREKNLKDELNNKILELYFYYGNAIYYMETKDSAFANGAQDFDEICYEFKKGGKVYHSSFDAEYAYERFNIRLISWECSPPIENSFK